MVQKVIPPLRKGVFGKGYFSKSEEARRKILISKAKTEGEKRIASKLRALQVLHKKRNPYISIVAKEDANYVHGAFRGDKFVGYPEGFGSSKRVK